MAVPYCGAWHPQLQRAHRYMAYWNHKNKNGELWGARGSEGRFGESAEKNRETAMTIEERKTYFLSIVIIFDDVELITTSQIVQ